MFWGSRPRRVLSRSREIKRVGAGLLSSSRGMNLAGPATLGCRRLSHENIEACRRRPTLTAYRARATEATRVTECAKKIKIKNKNRKVGATRGLPRRSPILVLLSPKHAKLRSSDGIRCISAGMIAPNRRPSPVRLIPFPVTAAAFNDVTWAPPGQITKFIPRE